MVASDNLNPEQFDYRLEHRAPVEGLGLHRAGTTHYPDARLFPQWYGRRGSPEIAEAAGALERVRGKPNAQVDIYRALPREHHDIHPGDWVTTSRTYAEAHAEGEDYHVLHAQVAAKHVVSNGEDIHEYGYAGPHISNASATDRGRDR